MRIVVVGTGFGSRVVAPVFDSLEGCEVATVVSPRDDAEVDAAIAAHDVDLVSVHSPPFLHANHVRRALASGCAVLCDKPFTRHADEASGLLRDAEAAEAVHLVNYEFRYDPGRLLLRHLVRAGAVGTVEHVQWTHLSAGSRVPMRHYGWLFSRELGGGWVGAWASHAVDTVRWLLGEITGVAAIRRLDIPERPDAEGSMRPCTAEDGLSALLTLAGGETVALDSTCAASANVPPRIAVAGSDGILEWVAGDNLVLHRSDGGTERFETGSATDPHPAAMRRFAEVVRDAVHSGEVPPDAPTFADGLACDLVLDRLRAAPLAGKA